MYLWNFDVIDTMQNTYGKSYAFKVNTIVKLIIDCQGYHIYVYYIVITF